MQALSFGEILWDIIDAKEHIGGAPLNLASHLAQMGEDTAMVSAVGADERGRKAVERLQALGIDDSCVSTAKERDTGVVLVELDERGSPSYDIRENSAWDYIHPTPQQLEYLRRRSWDVFCFGTLAQRSEENRRSIERVIEAASPRELFFDVNLRLEYFTKEILSRSIDWASILKLNDEELPVVSRLLFDQVLPDERFCKRMRAERQVHTVCITRGKEGASVYRGSEQHHVPVVPVKVVDTVGAGDSFSAAFLHGLLKTGDAKSSIELAVLVSSYVASKSGAVPEYDESISKAIEELGGESTRPGL
jgi:fructokinase